MIRITPAFILFIAAALLIPAHPAGAGEGRSPAALSDLFPDAEKFIPDGNPTLADNEEDLFAAINGGAELYIRHGFSRAAFQTFKTKKGAAFNLDIIEMKNPGAAKAIHAARTAHSNNAVDIGEEGILEDYYLMFRQGRFCVTLTALDSKSENAAILAEAARQIASKITEIIVIQRD